MTIDLKLLTPFLTAARANSFTKAAAELGISQPRLSLLIKQLEQQIGFSLFLRTHRSIELTAEGRSIMERASAVSDAFQQLDEAIWQLRGEARSRVRLGSPRYQIDIPERNKLFQQLTEKRPNLQIVIDPDRTAPSLDRLRSGSLDLVLATAPFDASDLVVKLFATGRAVLAMPANDSLSKLSRIPVDALRGRSIVGYPQSIGQLYVDAWYGPLREAGAVIVGSFEEHVGGLMLFAAQRHLPALVHLWSDQVTLPLADRIGDMVYRPIDCEALNLQVYLAKLKSTRSPIAEWVWGIADEISDEARAK
jgi:DNA-binding transcriptional LysR family regulator